MNVNNFKTVLRCQRGNVLITALLLVFATSIVGATIAMMSATDLKISGNQEQQTEAFFSAEAGLAEAIHRMSFPNPTVANVGGADVNIALADKAPYDPNWKVHIMMGGAVEAQQSGSTWTAGTMQDLTGDYLEYSQSTGTDDVITIEHKWEDRNGNGSRDADEIVLYDPNQIPPENFDEGNPIEVITVTGQAGRGERVLQAEVTKQLLIARTLGAFYTDKAVEIKGSSSFCGWNHDMNMPIGTRPNACFAYHLADGHLSGVTTTGDLVTEKGGAHDIEGDPETNTNPTNPWYTLAEMLGISQGALNQILASADNTTVVNPLEGITFVNGDATLNSTTVGHGLLYVAGDLVINGGAKYWGLVYVEGDCHVTGTPWILGSVVVKGTADWNFGAGNCGVLYSQDAISQYVGDLMPMVTLAWRDL